MNKDMIIQKLREVIHPGTNTAILSKIYLEGQQWTNTDMYKDTIKTLSIFKELEKELGYKEDEQTGPLKQSKIDFQENKQHI